MNEDHVWHIIMLDRVAVEARWATCDGYCEGTSLNTRLMAVQSLAVPRSCYETCYVKLYFIMEALQFIDSLGIRCYHQNIVI